MSDLTMSILAAIPAIALAGFLIYRFFLARDIRIPMLYHLDGKHSMPPKFKAGKKRPIESWDADTGEVNCYPSVAAAKRAGAPEVYKYLNKDKTYLGLTWRDAE